MQLPNSAGGKAIVIVQLEAYVQCAVVELSWTALISKRNAQISAFYWCIFSSVRDFGSWS